MYFFQEIIKVHQVLFSKLIKVSFLVVLLTACNNKEGYTLNDSKILKVDKNKLDLKQNLGLVYYKNKPFTGQAISYYSTNKLAESIQFFNGKKHGYYKKWFDSGQLSFESNYQNGVRHKLTKTWWSNGNIRSKSNYLNGKVHGLIEQWYKSGAKFKEMNIINGKEHGLQKAWRENGKIYNNYEAKNGRIFGLKRANLCYELENEIVQYD